MPDSKKINVVQGMNVLQKYRLCLLLTACLLATLPGLPKAQTVLEEPAQPTEEGYPVEEPSPTSKAVEPIALREVSPEKWDHARRNLDYSKDVPEPPKEEKTSSSPELPDGSSGIDWTSATAGFGKFLQILAIILAVAAIAYWIFRLMQTPRNRRIAQDGTLITSENIEAYIHETDLDRFLREALQAGNYSLAIRLYYLQVIKLLSERGSILWSREKTNRDYLREMKDHRLGSEFRASTRTYERIWYGNQTLDATEYTKYESEFKSLLQQI